MYAAMSSKYAVNIIAVALMAEHPVHFAGDFNQNTTSHYWECVQL